MATSQDSNEPVAWMVYTEDGKSAYVTDNPHDLVGAYKAFALYTHPPRREWRGLTDEEIYEAEDSAGRSFRHHRMSIRGQMITPADNFNWHFARAIESKLKELNHE